uniref:Uncharacterized protein n=1 Tax=Chromera velia CCMP2878 TaxID=1169474 RepID=A0A0G4FRJ3_9ALVE|eukprot:Cvel_18402.t1-p1 / transcript=Cvel_18402.t1 / gene=Cvel_18402 / organism=Chromera_velia_CCMP2878 / gene_product=hypothetical protein / transcript_product=hypothetical protein / location=Cvel_scaffold1521:42850-44674(-) / protein_length=358 / sequence_SO=supercontig / SO=protein_coding / is_pseudo=false
MMGTSGLDDRAEASGRGRGSAAPPPPPVGVDISLLPDAAPSSSLSNSRSGVGTGEGQWEGTGGGKERGARGQRGQRAEKKETPLRLAALAEILRNSLSSSDAGVISSLVAEGEAARERGRGEEKRGKILAKSGLSELGRSSDSPAAAGGGGGGGSGMASSPSRMTTEGAEEAESKVWRRKGLLDVPLVVWAVILDAFAIIFCFSVGTLIIVVPRNCEAAASSSGKGEGCCPCPCCSDRCCCIPPGKAPTRQELLSPRKGHTNQHSKNKNPVGPEGGSPLPGGIQIPMRSPPLPPSPGLGGGGGARPLSPFSPLSLQRDNRLSPQRWNLQEGRGGGFTAQLTEAERRRAEREQEEPSSD